MRKTEVISNLVQDRSSQRWNIVWELNGGIKVGRLLTLFALFAGLKPTRIVEVFDNHLEGNVLK
jgi:hypothetical protein